MKKKLPTIWQMWNLPRTPFVDAKKREREREKKICSCSGNEKFATTIANLMQKNSDRFVVR